jgi:capsular polysaccharide biosynthesis protein
LNSVAEKLPADERELEAIKDHVEVTEKGDSILVSASAETPDLAVEIANTWARQAVLAINQAYSGDQPLTEIQSQLVSARNDYEDAQSTLESFIKVNQITLLEKKIDEAKNLLSEAVNDSAWQVSYYYNRKQSLQDLKVKAKALKQQLGSGKSSSAGSIGDAIALLSLHSNAFGIGEASSARALWLDQTSDKAIPDNAARMTFDLQLTELRSLNDTPASYAEDLDRIIQQADAEISSAKQALSNLHQNLFQGEGSDVIEATAAQIQDLQNQLEVEQARQRELSSNRDLAWEAYQALTQKVTEIKNSSQVSNQVTLASLAITPQKPASRGTMRNTLIAGMLGVVGGTFWVFGSMWWKSVEQPIEAETSISAAD